MNYPVSAFLGKAVVLVEVWHGDIIWKVKVGYLHFIKGWRGGTESLREDVLDGLLLEHDVKL